MRNQKRKASFLAFVIIAALLMAIAPAAMAADTFTATLEGQLDVDVSTVVGEWDIGTQPGAAVSFEIGAEATITMEFAEPVKFTGNWTGISTDIPVTSNDDAMTTGAKVTSFKVDGNELGEKALPLINRDDAGFMTIDIARQWGGSYDEYDLAGMDPFSKIEITFIVPNMPGGEAPAAPNEEEPAPAEKVTGGNAWIGGTFTTAEGTVDWVPFEDQKVAFEIGKPFVVTLDFGDTTNTHEEASWGYICVVQTDIMTDAANFNCYIDSIKIDGTAINFYPENIEVGFDAGVRVALTNGWSETPVVTSPAMLGEFYKMEVTLAFTEAGAEAPSFAEINADSNATDTPENPSPAGTTPGGDTTDKEGGFPVWAIVLIIAGVAVVIVIVVVAVSKKK